MTQGVKVDQEKFHLKLPKIEQTFKIRGFRKFEGIIKTATISKNPSNEFYASILIDDNKEVLQKKEIKRETSIGIDVGIKHFATLSNGEKIDNPKNTKKYAKSLAKHQKRLSRKVKGSNRRNKQKLKVAKIHQKISNSRNDFQHKVSTKLVKEFDTICIETLSVKNMIKNQNLSKSISDCAWSKFFTMLDYKCNWHGKNLLKLGRFEPSSKICSCGVVNQKLTLRDREWTCQSCNTTHDRDILAANNILHFCLQKQNLIAVSTMDNSFENMESLALA